MIEVIKPNWPAPAMIKAYTTTRIGGVSQNNFISFNLASHVEDDIDAVNSNRALLGKQLGLPNEPLWLTQVHGIEAVQAELYQNTVIADASYTQESNTVCAVLTADCLPVLICDRAGTCVAAIHAGWKGLAAGIIEATLKKLSVTTKDLLAWLGPAIGPNAFEVGEDVFNLFITHEQQAEQAFKSIDKHTWLANIYLLAKQRLMQLGVNSIYGGEFCTYTQAEKFFSYRRDHQTGRMASLIWIKKSRFS